MLLKHTAQDGNVASFTCCKTSFFNRVFLAGVLAFYNKKPRWLLRANGECVRYTTLAERYHSDVRQSLLLMPCVGPSVHHMTPTYENGVVTICV